MFYRPEVRPFVRENFREVVDDLEVRPMKRKSKRVTIKVIRSTFDMLHKARTRTGEPISVIMAKAVDSYVSWLPRRKRGRPRKNPAKE